MLGASWGSQFTDLDVDRHLSDDFYRDFANNLNNPLLSFNDRDFLDLDPLNHFFNWNLPHNLNNLLDNALHHHILDHLYHLFNDPFDDDFAPAIIYTKKTSQAFNGWLILDTGTSSLRSPGL